MIALTGIMLILAVCAIARFLTMLVKALGVDPWDALFYFGLAEYRRQ